MKYIKKAILKTLLITLALTFTFSFCVSAGDSPSWQVIYTEDFSGENDAELSESLISEATGSFSAQINSEALEMRSDNLLSWRANTTSALNATENVKGIKVVNSLQKFTYSDAATVPTGSTSGIAHHWTCNAGDIAAKFGNVGDIDALHALSYWCTAAKGERTNYYRFEVDKSLVTSTNSQYKVSIEMYIPSYSYANPYINFTYKSTSGSAKTEKLTPANSQWKFDEWFTWTFTLTDIDLTKYATNNSAIDYSTFCMQMPGYGSKIYDSVLYIHSVTLQNIDTNAPLFGADNNSVLLPINDGNYGDTQLTFDMMLPQNELFTSDVAYNSGANSMTVGIANEDQVDIATIQIETTDSAKNIYVISENDLAEKSKNLLYTGEISGETLTYSIALDWRAKTYTVTIKNGETDLVTESGPYNINNFASVNGTALGKYMKITHSVYSQCMMSVIDNIVFEYSEDASYIECKEDALSIELGTEKIESDFITLPLAGDNGTAINWASSDSAISVDNETGFATITRQSDDITVTLTATVSKDGMSYVRDIDVIVAEHEDSLAAKEDAAAIILDIPENGIVSENFTLPIQGSVNNSVISWVSNDAAIEINENTAIVVRSENEKEVVLTAFVTAGTKNATRNFIIKVASLSGVFAEITNISETVTDNKLTATMTVSYPAIEGNITFVAVSTDENTGTVLDRKTDTKVINSDNKYASVNFTITDLSKPTGSTVSYFLWDDNDVSIVNNAPSPVKNLTSVGKVKGVGLTWDNSEDDYNALSYDIYRDGEYIGSSDTNKYLDTSAENGAVYDYSVFPVDRNELAGDSDDTRNSGELPIMYYIDINARESGSSDFRYGMEDSVAMFLSDPAREIYSFTSRVTDGNGETFFVGTSTVKAVPFKALATAISGSDKELVLEIEYLDTTGSFNVAYNGIVPEGQNDSYIHALRKATSITMTNTRQWKTAVVRINDANLRGGSHCSGMHFQIQCSNAPSNVFIRKFSVIQADLYD